MRIIQHLSHILFCIVTLFIATWLSFFVEPVQTKYGNAIIFLLLVILMISLLVDVKKIREVFGDKKDIFLWLYALILAVGVFFSENRGIAINRYFSYAIPALVIYYLFKSQFYLIKNKDIMAVTVCILANTVSIVAILELIFHKNLIYEYFIQNIFYEHYLFERRAMSTQIVPQVLGTYLLCCLPISYFLINKKIVGFKILGILSSILLFCGIIVSFTRSALIAAIVVAIMYFYKRSKRIVKIIFIFFIILTALFSIIDKVKDIPIWRLGIKGLTSRPDYKYRLLRFNTTLKILKEHPFLGVGLDNYRHVFDKYHNIKNLPSYWKVPDNMHLMILGESGILGYLAFIFFVILLLIRSYRARSELAFAIGIAIIGILFNMLSYDLFYWTVPFYIFWIYCGILASIVSREKKTFEKSLSR